MKRRISSPSFLSWIRVSCHVANQASLLLPLRIRSRCYTTRSTGEVEGWCGVCDDGTAGVLRKLALRNDESMCIPCHWRNGCLDFVFVCLAIRRVVFRKVAGSWQVSLLDPESAATNLPWWETREGRVNTAPVNRRRWVTAVCGQTSHTCRSLNDASTSSSDGARAAVTI